MAVSISPRTIYIYITKGCHLHIWVFLAVNIFWGDRNWTKLAAYLRKAISISAEKHWTLDVLMKPRELGNRNAPSWGNAGVRWILKLNKLPHLWCSKVSIANWSNCEQRESIISNELDKYKGNMNWDNSNKFSLWKTKSGM